MLENTYKSIIKLYERKARAVCLFMAAIVLFIDFLTGLHIRFPLVFVLPVGLAAWKRDKVLSYMLAILLPLTRWGFHFIWEDPEALSSVLINTPVSIFALCYYVYLLDRIAQQKSALERRVKVLEGILPICASCKKIRNEKGEYESVEKYVSERSGASFSHTICPDCGMELYPSFFKHQDS